MSRAAILSLRLAQYRSYPLAEIATGGGSVVLTGPNGAGKTNLLEAVSMLVPGRGLRRAGAEEIARRPESAGWRLTAEIETGQAEIEVVTGIDTAAGTRRSVTIDGKTAPQTALGRHLRMVWLTPAMDRLWTEGAAERRAFLDRLALGFTPEHGEAAITYEKAMRARNRLLKEGREGTPPDPAWLGGLEAPMARAGARLARARAEALSALQGAQDEAETLFPRAELSILGAMESRFAEALAAGDDLDSLEPAEAAASATALEGARPRDAAAGRTLDGPHRSDLEAVFAAKSMPARACSTGEQKALLISLVLANARALRAATGATPVLLFDELAAHLDEGRRAALYDEIDALDAQAWMTGTEDMLFDGLPRARRFRVVEQAGRSTIEETR
ncbi:MAG: DNA replication/repair protein RecF [Pseudomonadota bacterium]